jgi:hypothetical protein
MIGQQRSARRRHEGRRRSLRRRSSRYADGARRELRRLEALSEPTGASPPGRARRSPSPRSTPGGEQVPMNTAHERRRNRESQWPDGTLVDSLPCQPSAVSRYVLVLRGQDAHAGDRRGWRRAPCASVDRRSWGGRLRPSTSPHRPWRTLIAGSRAAELMTAVYPWTRGAVKASIATSLKLAGHPVPGTMPLKRRDRPVARRNVSRWR